MALIPALCPQCGGTLEVDSSQEAAVCKFCGTPFITEKAVNNYVTKNISTITNNTVNHINGGEVHIHQDGNDEKTYYERVRALLDRGSSDVAYNTAYEMRDKFPASIYTDRALLMANV